MRVIEELQAILGDDVVHTAPVDARYHTDWSKATVHEPRALLLPRTTEQVSAALRICHHHGQPVVAQGGLTGLAGGAAPQPGDIVLSLERMVGVQEVDDAAATMTVWAGTTLETAQLAAADRGWELTLDLGARGSCTVGGNVATNAGGNRVIRYGMAREHVLGLEAVLADGTVVTSLNKMLKNNAGYDIKQLFIGSEGTLGVVTRVVLRLRPAPVSRTTALFACPDYAAVVGLLRFVQRTTSGLSAFEVMWPDYYQYLARVRGVTPPIAISQGLGVLVELTGDDPASDELLVERIIAEVIDEGLASDAFVARSAKDTADIWGMRESAPLDLLPAVVNFDVGLPIGSIGEFVDVCRHRLRQRWADAVVLFFGHIGDSNLHLSVSIGPQGADLIGEIDDIVYDTVRDWGGSISAEHGIGILKRPYLGHSRSPAELDVMRRIKAALDPAGILNPGKVLE